MSCLVQPTRIEPALLEPQGTREVGVVAANLLDEAVGVLSADLDRVA